MVQLGVGESTIAVQIRNSDSELHCEFRNPNSTFDVVTAHTAAPSGTAIGRTDTAAIGSSSQATADAVHLTGNGIALEHMRCGLRLIRGRKGL